MTVEKNAHQGMNLLMVHTPLKNCTSSSHSALSTCTHSSRLPRMTQASITHLVLFTPPSVLKVKVTRLAQFF